MSTLPFHVSCINKFELFWVARLTNTPPIPSNNHWVWVIKFYLQEMIHTLFKLLKDCNKLVWILQGKKSFIQNILNAILKFTLLFQLFKFFRFQSIYLLGNPNYISTMKCFFDKFAIKLILMRPGPVCPDVLLNTYSQGRSSVPPRFY